MCNRECEWYVDCEICRALRHEQEQRDLVIARLAVLDARWHARCRVCVVVLVSLVVGVLGVCLWA